MKKIFSFICLFVIVFSSLAIANEGEIICFYPQWQEGETQAYQVNQNVTENGTLKTKSASSFTLLVSEVLENGYILSQEDSKLIEAYDVRYTSPEREALNTNLMKATTELKIEYQTDGYGAFQQFVDISKLRNAMQAVTDTIADTFETEDEKNMFKQTMAAVMGSDQQLSMIFSRSLSVLHNPYIYGYEYEPNHTYQVEMELPNPWGGEPIPGYLEITGTRSENGEVVISIIQRLNKEKTGQMLAGLIEIFRQQMGEDAPSKEEFAEMFIDQMTIRDQFTYRFTEGANWLTEAKIKRTVHIMDQSRVDEISFQIVE